MNSYDFLICGSGIAGASMAFELAPHARVLVAEREEAHGYHTTGRSAAMYIESYGGDAVRMLTAASRAFFDQPPGGFTEHPLLTPRGCLTIAGPGQSAALDAAVGTLAAGAGRFGEIPLEQAIAMVPSLRADAISRAIFEPDAADIDTNALHAGFLRLAKARGAQFRLGARVESARRVGSRWRVVLAGGEIVEAGVVIDAAGAWADELAALAGVRPLGLDAKRRTAILIDPPTGVEIAAWPTVMDAEEQFYFKPQSGLLLASPADETSTTPADVAPEELDIAICVDRLQGVLDIDIRRVARSWAGLRTFAPDRIPVFGYDPAVEGFFWFAGQGGYGMQTAPAAARLGAAMALRQDLPAELADLGLEALAVSPARFGAATLVR
ncbi:MAG TPA: FAD-binding oxidoreductase [Caulobacteraceae bacterium]|nr:FAD-binding oxidoreductase [Caulobacteraceae bacterium]